MRLSKLIQPSTLRTRHAEKKQKAKARGRSRIDRRVLALATFGLASIPAMSDAAPTTGFDQTTAGTWDYNTTSNWVNNTINGDWDSSLTLTATQTVTFAAPTTLSTGLTFDYTGAFNLILDSASSTAESITLGGNITVNPASNETVTIGNATNVLNVDLGGVTQNFAISSSKTLTFINVVSDGGLNVSGGGTLTFNGANTFSGGTVINGGTLNLSGASGSLASSATVEGGATLNLDSSTSGVTGTTRAPSVTLSHGILVAKGNNGATPPTPSAAHSRLTAAAVTLMSSASRQVPKMNCWISAVWPEPATASPSLPAATPASAPIPSPRRRPAAPTFRSPAAQPPHWSAAAAQRGPPTSAFFPGQSDNSAASLPETAMAATPL